LFLVGVSLAEPGEVPWLKVTDIVTIKHKYVRVMMKHMPPKIKISANNSTYS